MLRAISSSRKRPRPRTPEGHVLTKSKSDVHEIGSQAEHLDHLGSLRALFLGTTVDFFEQPCGFVFFNQSNPGHVSSTLGGYAIRQERKECTRPYHRLSTMLHSLYSARGFWPGQFFVLIQEFVRVVTLVEGAWQLEPTVVGDFSPPVQKRRHSWNSGERMYIL